MSFGPTTKTFVESIQQRKKGSNVQEVNEIEKSKTSDSLLLVENKLIATEDTIIKLKEELNQLTALTKLGFVNINDT